MYWGIPWRHTLVENMLGGENHLGNGVFWDIPLNKRVMQLGRFKVNTFSNFKNSGIEVNVFSAIFYWIQGFQCHFCRKNVIFKDFQNLVSFDFPHFHIFCRISSPEFTKTRIGNTTGLVFEKMDAKVSKYWKHWIQYLVNPKVLKFWKHWIQYQILILKLLISRVSIVSQMEITR